MTRIRPALAVIAAATTRDERARAGGGARAVRGPRCALEEYLVNIGLGRGTAQKRVTGGRWRRIVVGDLLAGQVVELRGSPRLWP